MGDSWLDTVLARAIELRTAGVSSVTVDGCSVSFLPLVTPVAGEIGKPDASADQHYDALTDPNSYPGGVVPGFKIEKLEMED